MISPMHKFRTDAPSLICISFFSFICLQAMAKDYKNYYQDTPKQIRKKIMKFKSIPEQYKAYIEAKEKGEKLTVSDDDDE